jgi:hypothetical protein
MKKIFLNIITVAFCCLNTFSQGCLPDGITFTTQAQVDSFQINYPGCTEIEGDVLINGVWNIYNLNGLAALTAIGGALDVNNSHLLTDFAGLDNLTSIGGGLSLYVNLGLTSLTGLENLDSIGGQLFISGNYALTNLAGLEELIYVGGNFTINGSYALSNLSGLNNLTSIGGSLEFNSNSILSSMSGLESLASIGGYLSVNFNSGLKNLDGLDNIASGSVNNLMITYNDSLSDCAVESICNYLASPGGSVEIHDNAPGCNSPYDVEAACQVGFENIASNYKFSIYPNPSNGQFTFEFSLQQQAAVKLVLLNSLGQEVATLADGLYPAGIQRISWDSGNTPAGIYYLQLNSGAISDTQRLIINR